MTTGVPTATRWKSHSASGTCMRMHPCESEYPIEVSASVPWIPTPGADNPIHRVPSGLAGPGGTGFRPFAQAS